MSEIRNEIHKRRTFAIISHPDAGKTTLTEKLLLFGGAIKTAGAVKSNKIRKSATSDFMDIERQRGISVATSVMTFDYKGMLINILDTPGHKDFAEDTYRTLTAVDSVILVVDCVKGVEEQTEKLMNVCRMRKTPVIIFINKLDREGKQPFELMDELEKKLDITVCPLTWPIGMGMHFRGIYNLTAKNIFLFKSQKTTIEDDRLLIGDLSDPILDEKFSSDSAKLREDVTLIEGVYDPFSKEDYIGGRSAPVFFGSALNNFGVRELLETFVNIAPAPARRETDRGTVEPDEEKFSGFIFKIHANLDPRHRDRIAFLRVCSGKFKRDKYFHHVRTGRQIRFNNPYNFMAQRKNIIEEAYPGDVVGLYDRNNFKIGDTLTEGEAMVFRGIPNFSPEIFKEIVNAEPLKAKQLDTGIRQLTEEGLAQMFTQDDGRRKVIGTVGELQFDVISYRLEHEYGALCRFNSLNYAKACWITSEKPDKLDEFIRAKSRHIAYDKDEKPVFFAESEWLLNSAMENYPDIEFHFTSEFKTGPAGFNKKREAI